MNSTGKWEALDWNKIYEYNDDWRIEEVVREV